MNKENNQSAAGRRPSAVVARINLQAEWSALKGSGPDIAPFKSSANLLRRRQAEMGTINSARIGSPSKKESSRNRNSTSEVLRGVVALVEVGSEAKALPLRAALSALGASVLPTWSPLVTHLIWTHGGCPRTRARARALACRVVSPRWVEGCAAAARRLPERAFPAAPRPSDPPSPAALTRMLKKVESENIDLTNLLSDSDETVKLPRLRISTESEHDTTDTTNDTSRDTTKDTSRATTNDTSRDTTNDTSRATTNDTSRDTTNDITKNTSKDTSIDVESRVNTAPRRALPKLSETLSPVRPAKSRRKLFTNRDDEMDSGESDETGMPRPIVKRPSIKQPTKQIKKKQPKLTQCSKKELARAERVAKKLLASTQGTNLNSSCRKAYRPRIVLTGMSHSERQSCIEAVRKLGGKVQICVDKRTTHVVLGDCGTHTQGPPGSAVPKPRTLAALCGAARGCPVVKTSWVTEGLARGRWAHHGAHLVPHLRRVYLKARVERSALGKQSSEYAYDVFNGMRVRIGQCAHAQAAAALLRLCGAPVCGGAGAENTQGSNGIEKMPKFNNQEYDIKIGEAIGDIQTKWVFDSVAAARMRTTRRYVVKENSFNCELVNQMERMVCQ